MVRLILKHLKSKDIEKCRLVSKKWYHAISQAITHLKPTRLLGEAIIQKFPGIVSIDFSTTNGITDAQFELLQPFLFKSLQHIKLSRDKSMSNMSLESLSRCKSLKSIDLRGCQKTTLSGLAFLDQLCKLKCLKLGVPEAYTEHWKSLDKVAIVLGRLQDLTIERKPNHAAAHDKQVSQILSLAPNTLKLDLSGCPNINESDLQGIHGMRFLEMLVLQDCLSIAHNELAIVGSAIQLRTLSLQRLHSLIDTDMFHLSSLANLESLNLQGCESLEGLFFSSWVKMTVLKSLHMGQCTKLTAEGLACAASNFSSLHFLNVDRCTRAVMAINMSTLRKLPYLTELSARNVKCLRRTWDLSGKSTISKSYAAHTRLTKITLKGSYGYGEAGSASLISLVNTRHLDIDCCDMELFKSGARFIKSLVHLVTLSLKDCYTLPLPEVRHFSSLSSLKTLFITRCGNRTPDHHTLCHSIEMHLPQFKDDIIPKQLFYLWHLELGKGADAPNSPALHGELEPLSIHPTTSIQKYWEPDCATIVPSELYFPCSDLDAGISWGLLFPSYSVECLDLSGCRHITDKGLAILGKLVSLKSLSLNCCRFITGAGMGAWAGLTNLTYLDMEDCLHIVDGGLVTISSLLNGSLQHLSLSGCHRITDRGIAALILLRSTLSSLSVCACKSLSNSAMDCIACLTQLRFLDVSICTELDDQGLEKLTSLRSLTRINMRHCWKIGEEGICALSQLPTLRRINMYGCHRVSLDSLPYLSSISTDYNARLNKGYGQSNS